MNERNMLCSSHQIIDFESGQQAPNHLHPEPCILVGTTSGIPPPNIHPMLPTSGNANNFDIRHLPEGPDGTSFYPMAQYLHHAHPTTNLELGVPGAPTFNNNLYLNPAASGARVFPVPLNHGSMGQIPSSSSYRGTPIPTDDGVRGLCKRKNAEGFPGNPYYFNAVAGPSSSIPPAPIMDPSFVLPEYGGNNVVPVLELGGSQGSLRNRLPAAGLQMDSVTSHNYNPLLHGNYAGPSLQPSGTMWLERPPMNGGGDIGAFSWNGPPMMPFLHGTNSNGGSLEIRNSMTGYHEAAINPNPANFLHYPPILPQHHNLPPSHNVQGVARYGFNYYPAVPPTSSGAPTSNGIQRSAAVNSHDGVSSALPRTGFRVYRPHGSSALHDPVSRHRNLPHLRTLPADEVAVLEFQGFYEEAGDFIDHHRDMRLDIDDMSYEELLALSEQIGSVNTGLSEQAIACHLKSKLYRSSSAIMINLEELPCPDQKCDSCIICQDEYKDNDKLGTLECGHEYHTECLTKWLLVKNVCPVCKSTALTVDDHMES